MKEKWTEEMRRKLEGHRKPPPEGLWEGISEEMGFKPEKVSHNASFKRWYWAAAAAVLVVGGFFAFYHHDSTEQPSLTATNIMKQEDMPSPDSTETPNGLSTQEPSEATATSPSLAPFVAEAKPTKKAPRSINAQTTPKETVFNDKEPSEKVMEGKTAEGKEMEGKVSNGKETEGKTTDGKETEGMHPEVADQNLTADAHPIRQEADANEEKPLLPVADNQQKETVKSVVPPTASIEPFEPARHQPSSQGKWTMGLQASSGLLAANNFTGSTEDNVMMEANYMYTGKTLFNSSSFNELSGYTQSETYQNVKHHPPVRLGMSLQYQLDDRLALLTGINYAWLYSEFTKENTTTDQHLHYLGVPVGVAYQLWANRRFQCYVSGTVMLEKCLNEKPWQWSVDAGAGAEYAITQQVGLYFEPSLGYYFDDNTSFEHYYKDHPLAPSLMFGLRMHIE